MYDSQGKEYRQVKEDIQKLANDVMELQRSVRRASEPMMEEMKSDAQRKFNEAKDMAYEKAQEFKDTAQQKGKEIDEYAREHVWQTIGIVAAVSMVVGLLLGKKQDR